MTKKLCYVLVEITCTHYLEFEVDKDWAEGDIKQHASKLAMTKNPDSKQPSRIEIEEIQEVVK